MAPTRRQFSEQLIPKRDSRHTPARAEEFLREGFDDGRVISLAAENIEIGVVGVVGKMAASMAALILARKAGVTKAFFIDTGIEFPETVEFVEAQGVEVIRKAGNFWQAAEKAGPPGKDHRWCCRLQKLHPLKLYLETTGTCVTVQGNRWYESWNRADLDETSQNPANPLQLNISPIRSWRALEVFLYLWWQDAPINPLYDEGIERIGCMVCPAMLESEYEELRRLHPEYARRWDEFLDRWADKKGLPDEFRHWGLWRVEGTPPENAGAL